MKAQLFGFAFLTLVAISCAVSSCPKKDGKYAVHVANPADCGTFFKCNQGEYVLHECPAGLHYNAALEICDWPKSAGCKVAS